MSTGAPLRDAAIGVVGTGGIGGAVALRLVRMGARNLELADPDVFEVSNIQRRVAASLDTIGRNKAEVVAEHAYDLTKDVNLGDQLEVRRTLSRGALSDLGRDRLRGGDLAPRRAPVQLLRG